MRSADYVRTNPSGKSLMIDGSPSTLHRLSLACLCVQQSTTTVLARKFLKQGTPPFLPPIGISSNNTLCQCQQGGRCWPIPSYLFFITVFFLCCFLHTDWVRLNRDLAATSIKACINYAPEGKRRREKTCNQRWSDICWVWECWRSDRRRAVKSTLGKSHDTLLKTQAFLVMLYQFCEYLMFFSNNVWKFLFSVILY